MAPQDVSISGSMEAVPRFWGNSVEVEFLGLRVVRMGHAGETFTMNTPSLCFRGIFGMGRQFTEWSNEVVIQCEQSGLTATIDFVKLGLFGMRGEPNTVRAFLVAWQPPALAVAGHLAVHTPHAAPEPQLCIGERNYSSGHPHTGRGNGGLPPAILRDSYPSKRRHRAGCPR